MSNNRPYVPVESNEKNRKKAADRALNKLISKHRTEFVNILKAEQRRLGVESLDWHPLLVDDNYRRDAE